MINLKLLLIFSSPSSKLRMIDKTFVSQNIPTVYHCLDYYFENF